MLHLHVHQQLPNTLSSCNSELSQVPMTIDVELNRKFPFGIDLNKILSDLLRLRKNEGREAVNYALD